MKTLSIRWMEKEFTAEPMPNRKLRLGIEEATESETQRNVHLDFVHVAALRNYLSQWLDTNRKAEIEASAK